ncbi:MAG: CopG family transcriptional regulator [Alphaproteobacteria bacterium]
MRTIVDLPEEQVQALDKIGHDENVSRAELVRQAVDLYLLDNKRKKTGEVIGPDIFGTVEPGDPEFWDGLNGLEWERKMRAEWDHREAMYGNWGMHENDAPGFQHKPKDKK